MSFEIILLIEKAIPEMEPRVTHWLKCLRNSRKKTLMQHRVRLRAVGENRKQIFNIEGVDL
jgi:hypothetical protein